MSEGTHRPSKVLAKVAKLLEGGSRLVINKGREHGVRKSSTFKIFRDEGEVIDPDNGESLGFLSSTIGFGKVIQVQDKMAVLEYYDPKEDRLFNFPGVSNSSTMGSITTSVDELLGRKNKEASNKFKDVLIGDMALER